MSITQGKEGRFLEAINYLKNNGIAKSYNEIGVKSGFARPFTFFNFS